VPAPVPGMEPRPGVGPELGPLVRSDVLVAIACLSA
jgi:hypothetical protein